MVRITAESLWLDSGGIFAKDAGVLTLGNKRKVASSWPYCSALIQIFALAPVTSLAALLAPVTSILLLSFILIKFLTGNPGGKAGPSLTLAIAVMTKLAP
jgi:hypothetical protein